MMQPSLIVCGCNRGQLVAEKYLKAETIIARRLIKYDNEMKDEA